MQPLDIGTSLSVGWNAFTRNAVPFIVAALAYTVVAMFTIGICAPPMWLGLTQMSLRAVRGEQVEIGDVFNGFSRFGPSFVLMLIMGAAVMIGTMLCVVPGLAAAFFLYWAMYILADGEQDPMTALKESWRYSMENIGSVVLFVLVASIISGLGGAVYIGIVVTMPVAILMGAHGYLTAVKPALGRGSDLGLGMGVPAGPRVENPVPPAPPTPPAL